MRYHGDWRALAPLAVALAVAAGVPATATAAEGTEVTLVLNNEPDRLDPCEAAYAAIGLVVKQNVNETLLDIDPLNAALSPRLAKSWEQVSPTTWRFHLVENATFHDGAPFNADAVVFNVERAMNPAISCSNAVKGFSGFKLTAKAVDEFTVDVTADRPAPIMPTGFSVLTMASPNTPVDQFVRSAPGTGPYTIAEWEPGNRIVLERTDDYWGETPEVTKATYVFRTESAVRAAMVEAGEADIALAISEQDADDPALDHDYFNAETTWLRIDERFPPFDDVRVRMAVNLALDRQAMLGTVVNAQSVPAAQLPGPNVNGHNPNIEPYAYDPERARQLLAEAAADGVPVDVPVRFIARVEQWRGVGEMAEAMTFMLNDVGFNVTLEMMERARQIEHQAKPYPPDVGPNLILIQSDNNMGDAYVSAFNNFHSGGRQSTTLNPEIDALIEKADSSTGATRTETYQEIFRRLHEDQVAAAVLFYMKDYTRVAERLDWTPTIATNSEIHLQDIRFRN